MVSIQSVKSLQRLDDLLQQYINDTRYLATLNNNNKTSDSSKTFNNSGEIWSVQLSISSIVTEINKLNPSIDVRILKDAYTEPTTDLDSTRLNKFKSKIIEQVSKISPESKRNMPSDDILNKYINTQSDPNQDRHMLFLEKEIEKINSEVTSRILGIAYNAIDN